MTNNICLVLETDLKNLRQLGLGYKAYKLNYKKAIINKGFTWGVFVFERIKKAARDKFSTEQLQKNIVFAIDKSVKYIVLFDGIIVL